MQSLIKSSLVILAFTAGISAFAQAPAAQVPAAKMHQANPAHQTKALRRKLGLTADQAAQVRPILADRDQKVQALMTNTSLDRKSMHSQRHAIMRDSQSKLNAVLTPSQQQQLAAMRAAKHHHGQAGAAPAAA